MEEMTTEFLIGKLANNIIDQIVAGVQAKLPTATASQITTPITPPRKPTPVRHTGKNRHPKVLVVGLLPKQVSEITKDKYKLKLKFTQSEDIKGLEASMRSSKHVILMKDFIKHAHQQIAQKTGVEYSLVSGIMTSLKSKLRELEASLNTNETRT